MKHGLDAVRHTAVGDIRLLGEFVREVGALLEAKLAPKRADDFSPSDSEQLKKVGEALTLAAGFAEKPIVRRKEKPVWEMTLSRKVHSYIMQAAIPIKQQGFLAEMSLVYLVTRLEAFMKDYVREMMLLRPQMLRSSASMTHEEMLSHRSIRSLKESIAQREVDALGYGSIDDFAVFFQRKVNVDVCAYAQWTAVREHAYRRNLIVHNDAKVNDIYRRKTKLGSLGQRLHTDMAYVTEAVENIQGFVKFVHATIAPRFGAHET
jgi:hypothetical protein